MRHICKHTQNQSIYACFTSDYQPTSNLVKDENCDLLADLNNILNKWKNDFSMFLNVHRFGDVRYIEIHTAEPLVPEPKPFEVKIVIAK
jgi:uncharacterized protein (UPF0276 family)